MSNDLASYIWGILFELLWSSSRIVPMIELSWHTIYVNVLRWDCTLCYAQVQLLGVRFHRSIFLCPTTYVYIWGMLFELLWSFSRIMLMIEISWHTVYVNVLRWDCSPCAMHRSRCCASYLANGSIIAYSCVQRPMYIYEAVFLIYFGLFRE